MLCQKSVLMAEHSAPAPVTRLLIPGVLQPLDACYALEVMNDSHTQQLLPRMEQPHTEWEAFAGHCVDCKVG